MDGIIVIDKPEGKTSFAVVGAMRKIMNMKKIGHAGTLDPMATGVLPIFLGRATKCCDILPCQDKRYTAHFRLGLNTDTLDITGTVLKERPVHVTGRDVEQILSRFVGIIQQIPPMYSAIQIDGKRLYDLARQGIEVERPARTVEIKHCHFLGEGTQPNEYIIDVACSKGTYIRTLCQDIGEALGCGATMTALRRTEAAGFTLDQSITLEQAKEKMDQGELFPHIHSVESVFSSYPALILSPKQGVLYQNGMRLDAERLKQPIPLDSPLRVLDYTGQFLGIGKIAGDTRQLVSLQLFSLPGMS